MNVKGKDRGTDDEKLSSKVQGRKSHCGGMQITATLGRNMRQVLAQ